MQQATQHINQVTIRRRKLVSEYVLWLVVGMAFFRNEPLIEIARRLSISIDDVLSSTFTIELGFRDIKSSM